MVSDAAQGFTSSRLERPLGDRTNDLAVPFSYEYNSLHEYLLLLNRQFFLLPLKI